MKELLDNAVLSIELGVEDYQTGDERRVLSAIRNLYAGVLLLCKQVLWNKSPPGTDGSLIYKDSRSAKDRWPRSHGAQEATPEHG